ncbi:glycoside hydrolase family 5 protein [Bradyrhizobium sp. SUTN9-2]|uniref:glycoside hydrolase family 5 protein n=1 Tax=Bradyrhizobium sp. SUTN9-2 TaxID=1167456 RepID=UPI0011B27DE1|nr:glycoside hydrolase family 5 protein [Bradyrhizobium sp. SUTN9-2]
MLSLILRQRTVVQLAACLMVALANSACTGSDVRPQPTKSPMLRGINLSGQIYANGELFPANSAINYFLVEKRMNFVRLLVGWEQLQPELFGALDVKQVSEIDAQVRAIVKLGGKVQIEIHSFGRRSIEGVEYVVGETEKVSLDHFADLWQKIAARWRDYEDVIFELQNEPHDQDTRTLIDAQNAAIAAIRRVGAKNLIVVSGNDWSHPGWFSKRENRTWAAAIHDPLNNFAFSIHHYFDKYSAGKDCYVQSTSPSDFDEFVRWARLTGRRAMVGEFAACATKDGHKAVTELLNYVEKNADVFFGWAWWAGGGWWQDDYIFLLDPYASQWDKNSPDRNVALGGNGRATTWAHPRKDRPQMKYLEPYLSATGPLNEN